MLLQESGQRAIIDHCSANGFQSSGAFQSLRSHKHAATSCAGGRAPGIANPGWRAEHEKEIYEGGNEQLFWKAFARQLHHKRDQIIVTLRSNETRFATVSGPCSTSASVSMSHAGLNARARSRPWCIDHNFPVHPAGKGLL